MIRRDPHSELPLDPDPSDVRRPPRALHAEPGLLCAVALGAVLGTPARYGLGQALPTPRGGWPLATFIANMVGAMALGLLLETLARRGPDAGRLRLARLALGTGALGAFTTYSTLAVESDLLVRGDHLALALAYAAASVLTGVLATVAGIRLGTGRRT
jgi:CrcB protein